MTTLAPSILPALLPGIYQIAPGTAPTASDVDTGGYDFSIGGNGFRFATDQQNPYQRVTEPTTANRFDNGNEPGEQSLAPLPWIKSQESFHGGAGQLNLEQGFTSFQYDREQVAHVRFDTCVGVDVWTPGIVQRLPTTIPTTAPMGTQIVAGTTLSAAKDYAVIGGTGCLYMLSWPNGTDAPAVKVDVTMTGYGGTANVTVQSLVTDGRNWYGLLNLTADGTKPGASVRTVIVKGTFGDTSEPALVYKCANDSTQHLGTLGWAKARLVAGIDGKFYELDANAASALLPTQKYTHPVGTSWRWTVISDAPTAILAAGNAGYQSEILAFTLDNSGAVPTLSGAASVGKLPHGETITSLVDILGSFLAVGTTKGCRIGSFDTYSGALKMGPLTVESTTPTYLTTRDRFVYGTWGAGQLPDGQSGLFRVDVSYVVDATGRNAWAPDLRPPSTSPSSGVVNGVTTLPVSNRIVYLSPTGVLTEGSAPSGDGVAWLRTSRIRYGTTEPKLFKSGQITGTLYDATITVKTVQPFGQIANTGIFGDLGDRNPGEFGLPSGLHEWVQMQFQLNGPTCQLSSYQVKAYPSPKVQDVITLTANCFTNETDKAGLSVTDPRLPRDRFEAIRALKRDGQEVRYVEFTNQGSVALQVLIDQVAFVSYSRPSIEDDFGGYITMKLRVTQ